MSSFGGLLTLLLSEGYLQIEQSKWGSGEVSPGFITTTTGEQGSTAEEPIKVLTKPLDFNAATLRADAFNAKTLISTAIQWVNEPLASRPWRLEKTEPVSFSVGEAFILTPVTENPGSSSSSSQGSKLNLPFQVFFASPASSDTAISYAQVLRGSCSRVLFECNNALINASDTSSLRMTLEFVNSGWLSPERGQETIVYDYNGGTRQAVVQGFNSGETQLSILPRSWDKQLSAYAPPSSGTDWLPLTCNARSEVLHALEAMTTLGLFMRLPLDQNNYFYFPSQGRTGLLRLGDGRHVASVIVSSTITPRLGIVGQAGKVSIGLTLVDEEAYLTESDLQASNLEFYVRGTEVVSGEFILKGSSSQGAQSLDLQRYLLARADNPALVSDDLLVESDTSNAVKIRSRVPLISAAGATGITFVLSLFMLRISRQNANFVTKKLAVVIMFAGTVGFMVLSCLGASNPKITRGFANGLVVLLIVEFALGLLLVICSARVVGSLPPMSLVCDLFTLAFVGDFALKLSLSNAGVNSNRLATVVLNIAASVSLSLALSAFVTRVMLPHHPPDNIQGHENQLTWTRNGLGFFAVFCIAICYALFRSTQQPQQCEGIQAELQALGDANTARKEVLQERLDSAKCSAKKTRTERGLFFVAALLFALVATLATIGIPLGNLIKETTRVRYGFSQGEKGHLTIHEDPVDKQKRYQDVIADTVHWVSIGSTGVLLFGALLIYYPFLSSLITPVEVQETVCKVARAGSATVGEQNPFTPNSTDRATVVGMNAINCEQEQAMALAPGLVLLLLTLFAAADFAKPHVRATYGIGPLHSVSISLCVGIFIYFFTQARSQGSSVLDIVKSLSLWVIGL